jgi:zinc transport system ATP-binding protein
MALRPTTPALPDGPILAAEGVGVRREGRWLLEDIDLAVEPGQAVTLIGPNGAGKTTLVKTLIGLVRADAGQVRRAPGLTVGYVPQRLEIDRVLPLTVARLMTATVRKSRRQVREALAETGTEGLIDAPVQTLSGGEFRRVLLARALLRDPQILVLDEPVQGVDFAGEAALYQLIADIRRRRGCAVLMVSHDLHVVMATTEKVVCLNRHVCCHGRPAEVSYHPEYLRLFGPKARAYAVYAHQHDHRHELTGEAIPLDTARACDHGHEGHGHEGHGRDGGAGHAG